MKVTLTQIQDYFENIAKLHPDLLHDQQPAGEKAKRKAFYRHGEDPVNWSNKTAYKCYIRMHGLSGKYRGDIELVEKLNNIEMEILCKAKDNSEPEKMIAVQLAETIMDDLISYMQNDVENNDLCIVAGRIQFEDITFDSVGPVNQNDHGYRVTFPLDFEALEYDADKWSGAGGEDNPDGVAPQNFTDFTYNQDTGDLTFSGGNNYGVTQLDVKDQNGNNVLEGGVLVSVGSITNTNVVEEFGSIFSVRTLKVKWRRQIASGVFTEWAEKNLVITRLAYRKIKLFEFETDTTITEDDLPIFPVNVNGDELAEAATMDDYITIWNADAANAAKGVIMSYTRFPSSMAQQAQYYRFKINFANDLLTVPFTRFEATPVP